MQCCQIYNRAAAGVRLHLNRMSSLQLLKDG